MKIPLKSAAKKAYKQIKSDDFLKCQTYAQFLDTFATWCGYRHIHEYAEAHKHEMHTRKKQDEKELTPLQKKSLHLLRNSKGTSIVGPSGSGKTVMAQSIITSLLSTINGHGKRIRLLDYGKNYEKVLASVGTFSFEKIDEQAIAAWNSDAPLVAIDLEKVAKNQDMVALETLMRLNKENICLIIEECWFFADLVNKRNKGNIEVFLEDCYKYILIAQAESDIPETCKISCKSTVTYTSIGKQKDFWNNWIYVWDSFDPELADYVLKTCAFYPVRNTL